MPRARCVESLVKLGSALSVWPGSLAIRTLYLFFTLGSLLSVGTQACSVEHPAAHYRNAAVS